MRDGVIAQLSRIYVGTLGRFHNPFGESGAHQRGHGGLGLLTLYLSPSVVKRFGDFLCLIGIKTGF
jgi:hypothetical protein